jgi:hypothetical protein
VDVWTQSLVLRVVRGEEIPEHEWKANKCVLACQCTAGDHWDGRKLKPRYEKSPRLPRYRDKWYLSYEATEEGKDRLLAADIKAADYIDAFSEWDTPCDA